MQIRISWDKNFQCWAIARFIPTYCFLMDKAKSDFVKVPFGLVTLISTFLFKLKTIPQERLISTGVALYGDWVQEVQENRRCPKTAQFARDYKKKDRQKNPRRNFFISSLIWYWFLHCFSCAPFQNITILQTRWFAVFPISNL